MTSIAPSSTTHPRIPFPGHYAKCFWYPTPKWQKNKLCKLCSVILTRMILGFVMKNESSQLEVLEATSWRHSDLKDRQNGAWRECLMVSQARVSNQGPWNYWWRKQASEDQQVNSSTRDENSICWKVGLLDSRWVSYCVWKLQWASVKAVQNVDSRSQAMRLWLIRSGVGPQKMNVYLPSPTPWFDNICPHSLIKQAFLSFFLF